MKVEQFKNAIERIGETLDPDGDWLPTFFIEKDGKVAVMGLFMPDNLEGHDMVARLMTIVTAITNADAACFISTAWIAPPNPDGTITRPRDHPNRKEIINGYCMGIRGEADGEAMMMAKIRRSPDKPPVLYDWQLYESEGEDECTIEGRFPDAIREGFRLADLSGNLERLEIFKKQWEATSEDEGAETQ